MQKTYDLIKTDYLRYQSRADQDRRIESVTFWEIARLFSLSTAFKLGTLYRLSVPIYNKYAHKKRGLWLIPALLFEFTRFLTGSEIDPRAEIGPGLKIIHGMGIIIGIEAKIGANAYIYNDITIGYKGVEDEGTGQAVIGNNVRIGTGARLLGNIEIGDNVVIGANSVVTKSFPADTVVAGIPAKIIKHIEV